MSWSKTIEMKTGNSACSNVRGASLTTPRKNPRYRGERFTQFRNDLTLNLANHEIRAGGEYFYEDLKGFFGTFYHGEFLFNQNPTDWAAVVAVPDADRGVASRALARR